MRNNRGISKILLSITLFSFILTFLPLMTNADGSKEIEVDFEIGYENFYKYNQMIPVRVEVKNNGEDINGNLKILFPTQFRNKQLFTAYSQELRIAKGATKFIDFPLIITENIKDVTIRITNENGNTIWEDKFKISRGLANDSVSIGVLSDDVESLGYFNTVLFPKSDGSNKSRNSEVIDLNSYVPEDWKLLELFDIIIVNNYDTELLNNNQLLALKTWVDKGGVLLVGTGPNYQKTLKGLENLNFVQAHGTDKIDANILFNSIGSTHNSSELLTLIKADSQDEDIFLSASGTSLIYNKKLGLGNITITGFDLGLSPIIDWGKKAVFFKGLLEKNLRFSKSENDSKISTQPTRIYSGRRYFHVLEYIPMNRIVSPNVILGIIVAFILLIGPINYIVLKKLDMREKAWITIPAIVLIFSLVIYIWGFRTRFDRPLVNSISIVKVTSDTDKASINTTSGVLGFKNGDVSIKVDAKESLFFNPNYAWTDNTKFQDGDIILEYVIRNNSISNIIFKKSSMWDLSPLSSEGTIELDGKVNRNLHMDGNKVKGEIENLSNLNIEDAVLIYGGSYIKLGDINKGDKKTIDVQLTQLSTVGARSGYYDIVNKLYPWNSMNSDDKDILNDRIKREILDGAMGDLATELNSNKFVIIGWSRDPLSENIVVNGVKPDRIDRNLIFTTVEMSYEEGKVIDIPEGVISPKILTLSNMNYEWMDQSLYGTHGGAYVEFSFKPNVDIELQQMKIDITPGMSFTDYDIFIFNYDNSEWERYDKATFLVDKDNKGIYYSSDEGTKIKISNKSNNKNVVKVPSFSVKGVVK